MYDRRRCRPFYVQKADITRKDGIGVALQPTSLRCRTSRSPL